MAANLPAVKTVGLDSCLKRRAELRDSGLPFDEHWDAPEVVEPNTRDEARHALTTLASDLDPVNRRTMVQWLAELGTMTVGRDISLGDAKAKAVAYVRHLHDVPAAAVTSASLERAGRLFKWFPSYGEVRAHLEQEAAPYRIRLARLQVIADTPTTDELPPPETAQDRARIESGLADIKARLRAATTPTSPANVKPNRLGHGHLNAYLGVDQDDDEDTK